MIRIGKVISLLIIVGTLLTLSNCSVKKTDDDKVYTATFSVLQKDGYSNIAGRTSALWPPHTTTVFSWSLGSAVQLNHGQAIDVVDKKGNFLLEEVEVYSLSGTANDFSALQEAYMNAACDADNKLVFGISIASSNLEKAVLDGVKEMVRADASFKTAGFVSKDSLLALFEQREYGLVVKELPNCNWKQSDWKTAFETSLATELAKEGKTSADYHICNNDAYLQVELIKNFIATGKVELNIGSCDGPRWYYAPTK